MTIADTVKNYFMDLPDIQALINNQTRIGLEKYGQTLDDNEKDNKAKAVHIVQELIDTMQYFVWLQKTYPLHSVYIEYLLDNYRINIAWLYGVFELTVEDLTFKEGHS